METISAILKNRVCWSRFYRAHTKSLDYTVKVSIWYSERRFQILIEKRQFFYLFFNYPLTLIISISKSASAFKSSTLKFVKELSLLHTYSTHLVYSLCISTHTSLSMRISHCLWGHTFLQRRLLTLFFEGEFPCQMIYEFMYSRQGLPIIFSIAEWNL